MRERTSEALKKPRRGRSDRNKWLSPLTLAGSADRRSSWRSDCILCGGLIRQLAARQEESGLRGYALVGGAALLSSDLEEGTGHNMRPIARKTGLVVEDVDGEILVYDLDRNEAHCLKGVTALVWRQADGQLPVETIVERMREGSSGISEDDVWSALESLSNAQLLVEPIAGPSLAFIQSHRQMMGQRRD
jgi:hypothetical protein